jgi:hypothetical protein
MKINPAPPALNQVPPYSPSMSRLPISNRMFSMNPMRPRRKFRRLARVPLGEEGPTSNRPILGKSGSGIFPSPSPFTLVTSLGTHDHTREAGKTSVASDSNADKEYTATHITDGSTLEYISAFTHRLVQDMRSISPAWSVSTLPSSYIEETLRSFSGRLHEESEYPFQWETAVNLRQHRK